MASNTNVVVLTGNLVSDPDDVAGGHGVEFALAVNESFRKKDEEKYTEYTSYIDVTVWGAATGPVKRYLAKGSRVTVTGKLKQERWETKEGQKRSKIKVHATNVEFGPKSAGTSSGSGGDFDSGSDSNDFDEEIPF